LTMGRLPYIQHIACNAWQSTSRPAARFPYIGDRMPDASYANYCRIPCELRPGTLL
jgi:hypothetical protein